MIHMRFMPFRLFENNVISYLRTIGYTHLLLFASRPDGTRMYKISIWFVVFTASTASFHGR